MKKGCKSEFKTTGNCVVRTNPLTVTQTQTPQAGLTAGHEGVL